MRSTLGLIFRINASASANRLIYYLRRIPLVGKRIPEGLYRAGKTKLALSVVATAGKFVLGFLTSALYVLLFLYLPVQLAYGDNGAGRLDAFVNSLFWLSFVGALLIQSRVLYASMEARQCVKLMHMPAQAYCKAVLLRDYSLLWLHLTPSVTLAACLLGAPWWWGPVWCILLLGFRLGAEALVLLLYERRRLLLPFKNAVVWGTALLGLAGAVAPLPFRFPLITERVVLSLPFVILSLLLLGASLWVLSKSRAYAGGMTEAIRRGGTGADLEKEIAKAKFADVDLKEKEFSREALRADRFEQLHGYRYLNALFFERHKRQLVRPVFVRTILVAIIAAILLFVALLVPALSQKGVDSLAPILPPFVFILYVLSIGDRTCRAMFYNCDISLLRYAYYRERTAILQNFRIRLGMMALLNLPPAAMLCLAVLTLDAVLGMPWGPGELLPFLLSILCLSLFFSVHHLCMYYVLQPYSTELNEKNPLFGLVNSVVYIACFLCLQIESPPAGFVLLVLGATLLYMALAILLVLRLSPKYFRVK